MALETARRAATALAIVAAVVAPATSRAGLRLLDEPLRLRPALALASGAEGGEARPPPAPDASPGSGAAEQPGSLDFDLLGPPRPPPKVDEQALRRRRTLLGWHQGVGLGMFALQLATTVVGQLNYDDRFGGPSTAKYQTTHAVLAYSTVASFVAAGTLALLAPAGLRRGEGFDRVSLHKVAMLTATAGMLAQGVLGIVTRSREGHLDQQSYATAHLVLGYVTLAAVATGVGALVF